MSRQRGCRITGFSLLAVLLVIILGGWLFLQSGYAARQIASALSDSLGAPVEVDGASVGLRHSEVQKVRLYEPGPERGEPWLAIENLHLALPLWDAVFGDRKPKEITLRGVTAILRLDRGGRLVTRLPQGKEGGEEQSAPGIRLEGGEAHTLEMALQCAPRQK